MLGFKQWRQLDDEAGASTTSDAAGKQQTAGEEMLACAHCQGPKKLHDMEQKKNGLFWGPTLGLPKERLR